MALGFEKQTIECGDLKKCGEITTMLSFGKKEFYLNCEFCDFSFLELENFMQHMYEYHLSELSPPNLETVYKDQDPNLEQDTKEHIQHLLGDEGEFEPNVETRKAVERTEDNDFMLRGFERVEIELDSTEIINSLDNKEEVISDKAFISEESQTFEESKNQLLSAEVFGIYSDSDEHSEDPDSEDDTSNQKGKNMNYNEKRKFIIELIEVYHSLRALWDANCPDYTDRMIRNLQYETLLAKYKEKYPNATKDDVRQKIYRLRTTFRRESKRISSWEKSPLYYFEAMSFLLNNDKPKRSNRLKQRLEQTMDDSKFMNKKVPQESLLNDDQFIILAKIYEKYPALWDETDISFRFSNRRREALKSVHEEFNKKSGLDLEKHELEKEILRLRKSCSTEKKEKIICKQKNLVYEPICPYYKHITFLETDVNPFECTVCGKVISGSGLFKVHMSSHDGSLPFKCNVCGHGFKLATNLTVHLRRHVHDYTYSCKVCNKPCATTTELKVHMRYHTGERPYVCDICGNKFQTASKFNTHMRRHENRPRHRCEVCSKGFYTLGLYREHMSVHQTSRNHICDVCKKGFKSPMQLKQHKRIHDALKKYLCKICGKRFAQFAGLSGHMKSHGTKITAKKTPAEIENFADIFLGDKSGKIKSGEKP